MAAANVRPRAPEVPQDTCVLAASIFEGVTEDGNTGGI
jgi:hypothetical protein